MWWFTRLAEPVMSKLKLLPLYHRVPVFSRLFMTSSLHLGHTNNEQMMVATTDPLNTLWTGNEDFRF
jgi:hypothetical protein